jgi:hypothetical protein
MAIGTALATIGVAAASGAASAGMSKLMGGGSSGAAPARGITGFNAGGLTGKFNKSTKSYNVKSSAEREGLVGEISSTFRKQAGELGELRSQVTPGHSLMRAARLKEIENARMRSVGNLRDNLARRRVMGSSFAGDALARAEAEYAQLAERSQAESYLSELEMTQKIMAEEYTAARGEFQTKIGEMNLQAEIATKLTGMASQSMTQMAELEAKLSAQAAAGAGKFFGDALQPAIKPLGEKIDSWMAPSTTSGTPN